MKALGLVLVLLVGRAHASSQFLASDAPISIGEINAENAGVLLAEIVLKSAPAVVRLRIDSPGGSVGVGLAFIDIMRAAQESGTSVQCTIPSGGMAASMAAVIFERCDVRTMEKGAALMFHTVSVGAADGNQWDLERLARRMAAWNKEIAILASAKMTITLSEYEQHVADFNWWLGREDALAVGAAD